MFYIYCHFEYIIIVIIVLQIRWSNIIEQSSGSGYDSAGR